MIRVLETLNQCGESDAVDLAIWASDGYNECMGTHSVADAKSRLPELIDRALEGEGIVITRHGRPVVELKPIPERVPAVTPADLDWLASHRIRRLSSRDSAGTLVSKMRDEETGDRLS